MRDNKRIQELREIVYSHDGLGPALSHRLIDELETANKTIAEQAAEIERLKQKYEPEPPSVSVGDRVHHIKYNVNATVVEISKSGKKVRVKWDRPYWGSTYVYPSSLQVMGVEE